MEEKAVHTTIKSLVLDFVHRRRGNVDYDALTREVRRHFPQSKWKRTHWSWYRSQILHGRFRALFSADELSALAQPRLASRQDTAPGQDSPRGKRKDQSGATRKPTRDPPTPETVSITQDILDATNGAVAAAQAYEKAIGGRRKLGITGEVGEILCCHALGLQLCVDPRSQGFDAVDHRGKRVQIKTRRSESSGLPRDAGRLSTFSKHDFDYALLVLLDTSYQVAEIWHAEHDDVADLIRKQKRRNPNLASFKRKSKQVWPAT